MDSLPLLTLTAADLEDLQIAVELRVIRYLDDVMDGNATAAERAVAWKHIGQLMGLLNKLRQAAGREPQAMPEPYVGPYLRTSRPSPTDRRGALWGDSTEEIDPRSRKSWRG